MVNGNLTDPQRWSEATRTLVQTVGVPVFCILLLIATWVLQEGGWLPSKTKEIATQLNLIAADLVSIKKEQAAATRALAWAMEASRAESRSQITLATCLAFSRTAEIQQQCLERYQREGFQP